MRQSRARAGATGALPVVLLAAAALACARGPEASLRNDVTDSTQEGATASLPRMEVRKKPRVFGRHAPRMGEWIPDLAFEDADGRPGKLSDEMGENGLIVVMRDPDCPLCKKYAPRIKRLKDDADRLGFGYLLVNPYDRETAQRDVEMYGFSGRYAVDRDERLVQALAANTTTEAFVIDAGWTLVYRGMIDDQYGLGYTRNLPDREYLTDALADVAAGRTVRVPATEGQGCLLNVAIEPVERPRVTYYERVSRILQNRCQRCHRPGTAAPFSLSSYGDAKRRAAMIELVVSEGTMPPWFSVGDTGPWRNDARLLEEERRDLLRWIRDGMPAGDPEHEPLPVSYPEGWTIEPDLVVDIPPNEVPAEGVLDYIYRYAETGVDEERYIKAVEILPGAPGVVHHILFWNESPELLEGWRSRDPEVVGKFEILEHFIAMMVPGQEATVFPHGFGRSLPADSTLKVQFHYTPNGVASTDATRIGFEFSDEKPLRIVESNVSADFKFAIPPHAKNHEVTGRFTFPIDGSILSLLPHGHLRAKSFRIELIRPDGSEELLLDIPDYDFNWQLAYEYMKPLEVEKGSILQATGWYDNSPQNPWNPDPEATVRFGRQTTQEMMVLFFQWSPHL